MTAPASDEVSDPFADPTKPVHTTIVGRKGTGKSTLSEVLVASYPYDRVVLDPTGDFRGGPAFDTIGADDLRERGTTLWSPRDRDYPLSYRVEPDPGSPTLDDDVDRAIGLAFHNPRKRCLLHLDERDEVTSASKTGPNMKRVLTRGRHVGLSLCNCGPRSVDMNPLLLSQADVVYVFDLPNVLDRRRLAETLGYEEKAITKAIFDLPGEYAYLRFTQSPREVVEFPPLPPELVRAIDAGVYGHQVRPEREPELA